MLICMRTTLNLNDDLVRQAKQRAAAEDRTLTSVIEDALRRLLSSSVPPVRREPYRVRLLPPSELQPGIDPRDPRAFSDLMAEDDVERYGTGTRTHSSGIDAAP